MGARFGIESVYGRWNSARGVLPYMIQIGMYPPNGYGFWAFLV